MGSLVTECLGLRRNQLCINICLSFISEFFYFAFRHVKAPIMFFHIICILGAGGGGGSLL